MLTAEYVKQLLEYDPATGLFRWLVNRPGGKRAGDPAGSTNKVTGYVFVGIDGKTYYGHRLAWLMMTGEWPENEVDHRDLNRSNNKWKNLRPATKSQQRANERAKSNNACGFKGVHRTPEGRWKARFKRKHIGHYDTPEKAHAAYLEAARAHYGEYARA